MGFGEKGNELETRERWLLSERISTKKRSMKREISARKKKRTGAPSIFKTLQDGGSRALQQTKKTY